MRCFRAIGIVLLGPLLLAAAVSASLVNAQGNIKPVPIVTEVIIPGTDQVVASSEVEGRVEGWFLGKVDDLAEYLETIYNFVIGIAGLVAATIMIVGGFQYLTAGGDANRVSAAKSRIANALIGLVLALSAYLLLNTINPALVNFKTPDVPAVIPELVLVPWCEDLLDGGINVTAVPTKIGGGSLDRVCGAIGEYLAGTSEEVPHTDFCIFNGATKTTRFQVAIDSAKPSKANINNDDTFAQDGGADVSKTSTLTTRHCLGNVSKACTTEADCGDTACVTEIVPRRDEREFKVIRNDQVSHHNISTCVQGKFTDIGFQTMVKDYTKRNLEPPLGRAYAARVTCTDFNTRGPNGFRLMRSLGFGDKPNMDDVCKRFQEFANDARFGLSITGQTRDPEGRVDYLDRFWNYCAWTQPGSFYQKIGDFVGLYENGKKSCVSVFLDCENIDQNGEDRDDGPGMGCEGYDENPEPYFATDDKGTVGQNSSAQNLEQYPEQATGVCSYNPCQHYNSNKTVRNAFKGGCAEKAAILGITGGGVIGTVAGAIGTVGGWIGATRGISSWDCRNIYGGSEDNSDTGVYCRSNPDQCK